VPRGSRSRTTKDRQKVDPLLPADGDYPTGPIDLFDESDPFVAAIISEDPADLTIGVEPVGVTVDANGDHHDRRSGRFTFKDRPVEYEALQQLPRRAVPGIFGEDTWRHYPNYRPGWEEVQEWGDDVYENPDRYPHVTIYNWPDDPTVEWETTYSQDGPSKSPYSVSRPRGAATIVTVESPKRRELDPPERGESVRMWALRNGFNVAARGRIPADVQTAYNRAAGHA
jgi:hypothetical protein